VSFLNEPNDLRKPVTWPGRRGIGQALAPEGITGETSQGIERRRWPCLSEVAPFVWTELLASSVKSCRFLPRSLSDIDLSTAANDPRLSASCSARKKSSLYSSEYTSCFPRPAASHLAAPPSPRRERQCRTGSYGLNCTSGLRRISQWRGRESFLRSPPELAARCVRVAGKMRELS